LFLLATIMSTIGRTGLRPMVIPQMTTTDLVTMASIRGEDMVTVGIITDIRNRRECSADPVSPS
jgi:hypothetical protein